MPPTSRRKRPLEGFILLHTLVLLLIGATLAVIILERSLGRAKDVRTELVVGRLELAAESGVQRALQQLLVNKGRDGVVPRQLTIDGTVVQTTVQFSDGLVGLRNRNKEYIEKVSAVALGGRGAKVSEILLSPSIESVSSYAGLAKLSGLGLSEMACLLAYLSLYIDNGSPVPAHAPPELRRLLRSNDQSSVSAVQGDINSVAGSVIRIRARASIDGYSSRELLAEVLVTGRLDNPYLVLDWLWMPANPGEVIPGGCKSDP